MTKLKQSMAMLAQRVQVSPYRTLIVWGGYLMIFLFIYGSMLVRGGYHWDETLDFSGGAIDTYIANGRWGLVLWRCVCGMGCAVWTSGVLAGVLLTLSFVLQTRLLKIESPGQQLLYGAIYLMQVQFAYQMDYFFLCDATAFGLLAVTVAAILAERGGFHRIVMAAVLVTFSVAVYQCLVLNFLVLLLLVILRKMMNGEPLQVVKSGIKAGGVCVVAVLLWYFVKCAVQAVVPADADAVAFCREYAERLNYREQLFSAEWYMYVGRMLGAMFKHALMPFSYDGEPFYTSAIVPLAVLAVCAVRKVQGYSSKCAALMLLLGLWVAPFSMYMVIGETWPCYPHTKLAQPLVLAAFWVLAIPMVKWPIVWRYVGGGTMIICMVQASALVSRHAAKMQASFEERLLRLHHTETEGVRVAVQHGIPLHKGCILYYPASHNWEKNGYVDFCGDYPALMYMEGATSADLYRSSHREHLHQMPVWPAEGSIRVIDGTVIIKGPEI